MRVVLVGLSLFIIHCILCCEALLYHISPDPVANETCTVNGSATLTPCYSLQQLCEDKTLLSNKTQLTLLLLPGTHVIPQGQTLSASDIQLLEISPWHGLQNVGIECQRQTDLIYKDIGRLAVFYLNFSSCSAQCIYSKENSHMTEVTVNFCNCIFANSREKNALSISNYHNLAFNVSISNCIFASNNDGAIVYTISRSLHLYPSHTSVLNIADTVFWNNTRHGAGSAIYMVNAQLNLQRSHFAYNEATSGGAMYAEHSSIYIASTEFECNTAKSGRGGAVYVPSSKVAQKAYIVLTESTFLENTANESGGAIACFHDSFELTIHHCHFSKNKAGKGGALFHDTRFRLNTLQLNNSIFEDNIAEKFGGAISGSGSYTEIQNCTFKKNAASIGGAFYSKNPYRIILHKSSFIDNFAVINGGAAHWSGFKLVTADSGELAIISCEFKNNSAEKAGGALYLLGVSKFHIRADTTFENNEARNGGAIYCECLGFDTIYYMHNKLDFIGNKASDGGAICAVNSTISLIYAFITMTSNSAENGGAIFLNSSQIQTHGDGHITFHKNIGTISGGAVFVVDRNCNSVIIPCFFEFGTSNFSFIFESNIAISGSALYGGLLDRCLPETMHLSIDYFKQHSQYKSFPLTISSDPVRVCLCIKDTLPNCDVRELTNISKMRGENIKLTVAVVDQDENPVLSSIRAYYNEPSAEVDVGEGRRTIQGECITLFYHVFATASSATLVLEPVGICERSPFSIFSVHINLLSCSRGFQHSKDRCTCERRITEYLGNSTACNIDSQSIERKGSIWLRYDKQHLQLHNTCPLDYCNVSSDTISLLSPDQQCANHRSGVICGACQDNHSIALGSSKCLPCTSRYTSIWLTLVFAVAGVALVALLLVFNMTISTGTLNGLIFYANVVSISGLTSLQNCSIHPIFSVFIAWLNLDFGVETCFYPGMDTYQKTWLQFAFPLYIWLLVVAIIVASYYSSTAMKVFGRNNIAILATLFLLSYSKLLKTIITALSVTQVLVGSAEDVSSQLVPNKVWTYDGNIEYLKGKHVALFTVALLLLLLLFLPYTLLLIFGQCVRSMSVRRWVLWWIRSTAFISIMDAYHAPYKRRHRYWTGFLLLIRCVLFLAFAASYRESDILVNMYVTNLTISGILVFKTFATKIYKTFYLSVLELCFLVNLEVLSATLYYLKGKNSRHSIICSSTNASISISLLLFIGILAYHTYLQIRKRKWYATIRLVFLDKLPFGQCHTTENTVSSTTNYHSRQLPTTTMVELREELL